MKMTVKIVIYVIISIFFVIINYEKISASENYTNNYSEEFSIDEKALHNEVPSEILEIIEENEISFDDPTSAVKITFFDVIAYMWEEFLLNLKSPIKVLISIICIVLISAVANSMGGSLGNNSYKKVFEYFTALAAIGVIIEPISTAIETSADILANGSDFMISYVPVFSGIAVSSGQITSATVYNFTLLAFSEITVRLSSSIIIPILSVCMSLGIIEAINPAVKLTSLTGAVTKGVKTVLGLIMTIFIGILSLQSIVGASADSLGIKAAKYLASNFIPIIGGAVADSYSTLKTSLGVLRSGVGFYGIIVIFLMIIPPVIELIVISIILKAGEIASDIFEVKSVGAILKNATSIISIMTSIVIYFGVILIISTGIVMMIGLDTT